MEAKSHNIQKTSVILALAGWGGLAVMIAASPHYLVYDEQYHIGLVEIIRSEGFFRALTSPCNQSAAGPLFALLQLVFGWATSMSAPNIRWVGFICLFITSILVSKASLVSNQARISLSQVGLCFLGVPFVWPCAGIALTEVPAMLFFSLALFCISKMLVARDTTFVFTWAASAGISLGVCILGRQTYLIILPVLFIWAIFQRKILLQVLCLFLAAMVCSAWVFIAWGGLVPPSQKAVDSGLRFDHAILAMLYIGVAGFILAPSLFRNIPLRLAAAFAIGAGIFAFFAIGSEVIPAKTIFLKIFGLELASVLGRLMLSAMFALSLLWLISLSKKIITQPDPFNILNFLILLAFIAAPAKISHLFSSRYVVTALIPLVFLVGFENSKLSIALKLIGATVGAMSLASYYGWI